MAETATVIIETPPTGNLSVDALGAMMAKGRKAKAPASTPKQTATPDPAQSEQASAEGEVETKPTELETAAAAGAAAEAEAKPEGEAEAEAEAPPEESSDDEDKAGAEAEAAQPKAKAVRDLQHRVHKVVDQRDSERNGRLEAERKLAQAEAQLAELSKAPAAPTKAMQANEQFAGNPEVVEIDRTLADVEAFLEFAERHPDGGSFEDGGKTYELDADQMRAFKSKSEKERIRLSSKREARLESARQSFLAKRAEAHTEAVKLYPWIERKESSEFTEAIKLIRENPGVLNHADFELIVARQVAGMRLENEARKRIAPNSTGKPQGSRTPPPVVTHAASAAPKVNGSKAQIAAVETQFRSSGKVDDLAKMLAARKAARMQPA